MLPGCYPGGLYWDDCAALQALHTQSDNMLLCAGGMRAEDRPPLPELRLDMQPQPSDVTEFTEAEDAAEDALASGLTVTFQVRFLKRWRRCRAF